MLMCKNGPAGSVGGAEGEATKSTGEAEGGAEAEATRSADDAEAEATRSADDAEATRSADDAEAEATRSADDAEYVDPISEIDNIVKLLRNSDGDTKDVEAAITAIKNRDPAMRKAIYEILATGTIADTLLDLALDSIDVALRIKVTTEADLKLAFEALQESVPLPAPGEEKKRAREIRRHQRDLLQQITTISKWAFRKDAIYDLGDITRLQLAAINYIDVATPITPKLAALGYITGYHTLGSVVMECCGYINWMYGFGE